ncbi:IclR family transcriptional regulator [Ferrovibrio sp. MS7]|uniref:IclR family transcriptional regulator n=1 Tax=Ferrovibrio plantarum TaxID=3119164 RepID=UPI0031360DE8
MPERSYSDIQSVARAAAILRAFTKADSWGPTDLAAHLGLHKSVVHRLLATMAKAGVLSHDTASGRYSIGALILQLAPKGGANNALKQLARPYLQRLVDSTGETVSLCVVEGNHGLCIDCIDSPQAMRFTVSTGDTFPLNAGCVGKVMLAFQPSQFIEQLIARKALKRYTPNTIVDPTKLRAELAKIRRLGHGFSDSEITPGSRSVGAPIYGADGQVIASLAISAPAFRMPDAKVDGFIAIVKTAAAQLSGELAGHPAEAVKIDAKPVKTKAATRKAKEKR